MKTTYFWLLSSLFVGVFTFTACENDDDNGSNSKTVTPVDYEKTGGEGTVTFSGGDKFDFTIPKCNEDNLAGVSIVNNQLTIDMYHSEQTGAGAYSYSSCSVTVEDYSESKTEYENVTFYFSQGNDQGSQSIQSVNDDTRAETYSNKLIVTPLDDGSYKFVITGEAIASTNQHQGGNEPNATINVEFVMPLAANATTATNVSSKKASYPSFTPWLNGKKADGEMQITKSQLVASAVLLWYYDTSLGYSDYEELKSQAISALGDPIDCYDKSEGQDPQMDWEDMCYCYFYKSGKFIMVSYCPWRNETEPEYFQLPTGWDALMETHAARIQVHAIEGMTFDFTALLNGHR